MGWCVIWFLRAFILKKEWKGKTRIEWRYYINIFENKKREIPNMTLKKILLGISWDEMKKTLDFARNKRYPIWSYRTQNMDKTLKKG